MCMFDVSILMIIHYSSARVFLKKLLCTLESKFEWHNDYLESKRLSECSVGNECLPIYLGVFDSHFMHQWT